MVNQANLNAAETATATNPSEMNQGQTNEDVIGESSKQTQAAPLAFTELDHQHRMDMPQQKPPYPHVQDEPVIQDSSNVDSGDDGSTTTAPVGRGEDSTVAHEPKPIRGNGDPSDNKRPAPDESRARLDSATNSSPDGPDSQRTQTQASDTSTDPVRGGDESATLQQQANPAIHSNQALWNTFPPLFPYQQLQYPPTSNSANQLDPTQFVLQQNYYFLLQLMVQSQSLSSQPSFFSGSSAIGAPTIPNMVDGGDGRSLLPFSLPGTGATSMHSQPTASAPAAAAAAAPATTNMVTKRGYEEMTKDDKEEEKDSDDDDEIEKIYCTKPKRPKSAYNYFFKDERVKLLEEIQDAEANEELGTSDKGPGRKKKHRKKISFEEMAKAIAKRWKEIDPARLSKYKSLARKDKKRYQEELELYREIQENTEGS